MGEKTFWLFNAVALAAMYLVPSYPSLAVVVLITCATLCLTSFLRQRDESGNPAYGLLGSLLLFSSLYGLLIFPKDSATGLLNYISQGSMWLGIGLWGFWIFRVSWRKKEASAQADG